MLFIELNSDVLLHVYGYLDLIDSVNLAETCRRLRDVAQQHYQHSKRFEIFNLEIYLGLGRRHNRIDAKTVLKHIGPFIRDLTAVLDAKLIGSDMGTSITTYCVNVESLKIIGGTFQQLDNPYTAYSEWLRELSLTKISLSIRDLFLIDLFETTTLDELRLHRRFGDYKYRVDYGFIADIFERNCNIRSLRIPVNDGFKYEIIDKLKSLERLTLDITYDKSGGHLERVAAKLKMTALEQVELNFITLSHSTVGLNAFLQKLSENALHLKDLSVADKHLTLDMDPLSSVQFPNLTSLRLVAKYPNLYKEIPKMQPNLKHLEFVIDDLFAIYWNNVALTFVKPMEQIIFLIKKLEKLEVLHIRLNEYLLQSSIDDFLQEPAFCRIFDCYSINRPTVTLRFYLLCETNPVLQVEFDFKECKWTWSIIQIVGVSFEIRRRFSGTLTELNTMRNELIEWSKNLLPE